MLVGGIWEQEACGSKALQCMLQGRLTRPLAQQHASRQGNTVSTLAHMHSLPAGSAITALCVHEAGRAGPGAEKQTVLLYSSLQTTYEWSSLAAHRSLQSGAHIHTPPPRGIVLCEMPGTGSAYCQQENMLAPTPQDYELNTRTHRPGYITAAGSAGWLLASGDSSPAS
ncbi:hypothetical protein NDU88_006813 [Pleurodeles waltl]|uniref:Uncharacterized protein n=1 Tax=Pleurodeles waltl TaxID=8319 RepID=A0AAV7TY92_PLEWA|nr:hypothetical protein NDU88_006813 [Pleurodeles waltl]